MARQSIGGSSHATGDHLGSYYMGNVAEAIRWMSKAVSTRPGVVEFRVNLATYLGRAGRLEEALAHLLEAMRIDDSRPELHNNIGAALATMDWRITDAYQDPPGESERFHTEKLWRMEQSCWCYTPGEAPDIAPEPPVVRNGYVTFASLNKIAKVSQTCARAWARVMEAVAGSRLLLTVAEGDADGSARRRLAGWGIDPGRIDIVGKAASSRGYLERFSQIDVALDTFPFNGITTTCDGLWMGIRAVSLSGATTVSRAGRSILHAAGLGELATDTEEQFVQIASVLAGDVDRSRQLRRSMRERLCASPLLAHRSFAAGLEQAYRLMAA